MFATHFKEIHICMSLGHQNIMKCVDCVDVDRNWFLMVMNKNSNFDLFDFIEKYEMVNEDICHKIFVQLLSGIKYLAKNKVIHRDIKDENIIIDKNLNIELIGKN